MADLWNETGGPRPHNFQTETVMPKYGLIEHSYVCVYVIHNRGVDNGPAGMWSSGREPSRMWWNVSSELSSPTHWGWHCMEQAASKEGWVWLAWGGGVLYRSSDDLLGPSTLLSSSSPSQPLLLHTHTQQHFIISVRALLSQVNNNESLMTLIWLQFSYWHTWAHGCTCSYFTDILACFLNFTCYEVPWLLIPTFWCGC